MKRPRRSSWDLLFSDPVFVVTSDQCWAPEWASRWFVDFVADRSVPIHVFRTHASEALDRAASYRHIDEGWHPNFLPGSTHGVTPAEVIEHLRERFPRARTVRSHSFSEYSDAWQALAAAGVVADSQVATLFDAHIEPLRHWSGIVRFPVYFEDDIFCACAGPDLPMDAVLRTLFMPGLKIFNVHAVHIACNTPNAAFYRENRVALMQPDAERARVAWRGRGMADVFADLLNAIDRRGLRLTRFEDLVDDVLAFIAAHPDRFPFAGLKAHAR